MSNMMSETGPVKVDLIADLACPWCYLGLIRLERAARGRPIAMNWKPFLLNPQLPEEGMDRQAYLEQKFGGPEKARDIYSRITRAGAEDGIDFAFGRMRTTPNTVRAQRLVLLAQKQGRGREVVHALFEALFIEGRDIGEVDELVTVAETHGLNGDDVRRYLLGDEGREAIYASHVDVSRMGVSGVPVFVVAERHAIAGAQPSEVLEGLLDLDGAGTAA